MPKIWNDESSNRATKVDNLIYEDICHQARNIHATSIHKNLGKIKTFLRNFTKRHRSATINKLSANIKTLCSSKLAFNQASICKLNHVIQKNNKNQVIPNMYYKILAQKINQKKKMQTP